MFHSNQIITASQLVKKFRSISRYLAQEPQAVLITRKNGQHLVLVNVEIFEDLVESKLRADGVDVSRSQVKDAL